MSAKRSSMHMTISDRTQSNRERATLATDVNISAKFAETTNNALVNCSRGTTLCMLLLHFRPNVNKEKKTQQHKTATRRFAVLRHKMRNQATCLLAVLCIGGVTIMLQNRPLVLQLSSMELDDDSVGGTSVYLHQFKNPCFFENEERAILGRLYTNRPPTQTPAEVLIQTPDGKSEVSELARVISAYDAQLYKTLKSKEGQVLIAGW